MTDQRMNFQAPAPKIPPRILCIGMPVRDLTFHTPRVPGRGSKENATAFDEICGGNALNAAIGIVRLGGRATICGPMGDAKETSSRFIFDQMRHEGIETNHLIHMPGLVTPISAVMIDPSGERTIVTFRDPKLWQVKLPDFDTLLEDCQAILTESRCAEFCTDLCAEAVRRGIPVVVDIDRAMVRRTGRDVSLVTYGGSLPKTLQAADVLAADGIECEVVDLRVLRPLDMASVLASVGRTRRCVIVDEGWKTGSLSAEIGMRIAEDAFFELDAPLRRVCAREVPIPYAAHLEDAALPQVADIVAAVRSLVGRP